MRLSAERVQELQQLLKAEFGLEYDHEQAQQAGLAIMRFVISKYRRDGVQEEKSDGDDKLSAAKVGQTDTSNTNN